MVPTSTDAAFVVDSSLIAGKAAGDTLYFVMLIDSAQVGTVAPPPGVVQIGSWVVGEADTYNTPAIGLFRSTWNGVIAVYTFTAAAGAVRGGSLTCYAYRGDCTHQQIVTGTNTASSSPRNSPTLIGTAGNQVLAFHGGSAATTTVTWSGGFTEREDYEYYGLNGLGEASSGTSVTATVTPSGDPTQSIWLLLELGPEGETVYPPELFGGYSPPNFGWRGLSQEQFRDIAMPPWGLVGNQRLRKRAIRYEDINERRTLLLLLCQLQLLIILTVLQFNLAFR